MSQENVDAVRAVYGEWETGNLEAGGDLFDPDILLIPLRDLPDAGRYLGVERLREFTRGWLEGWMNVTLAAEEVIEAGDSVVVATCQRGVGRGSRAPNEERYFQIWTFRGSGVIRLEHFRDRADALEAVGLSE